MLNRLQKEFSTKFDNDTSFLQSMCLLLNLLPFNLLTLLRVAGQELMYTRGTFRFPIYEPAYHFSKPVWFPKSRLEIIQ